MLGSNLSGSFLFKGDFQKVVDVHALIDVQEETDSLTDREIMEADSFELASCVQVGFVVG